MPLICCAYMVLTAQPQCENMKVWEAFIWICHFDNSCSLSSTNCQENAFFLEDMASWYVLISSTHYSGSLTVFFVLLFLVSLTTGLGILIIFDAPLMSLIMIALWPRLVSDGLLQASLCCSCSLPYIGTALHGVFSWAVRDAGHGVSVEAHISLVLFPKCC